MLSIGSSVRILGLPFYGISEEYENTNFVVVDVRASNASYVLSDGHVQFHFPIANEDMLLVISGKNKWNKLNYVSPFKPLKLP